MRFFCSFQLLVSELVLWSPLCELGCAPWGWAGQVAALPACVSQGMRRVTPGNHQWCGDGASPSPILLGGAVQGYRCDACGMSHWVSWRCAWACGEV